MLQLLRSLNYWGWVWVSMILSGTVPHLKALLGAAPACAAHMEVSHGGEPERAILALWRGEGKSDAPSPVFPLMAAVVPSPTTIERGRSPSPIAPLSVSFFLLPSPTHNSPCLAILCFRAHLPLHHLFSSKVGGKKWSILSQPCISC